MNDNFENKLNEIIEKYLDYYKNVKMMTEIQRKKAGLKTFIDEGETFAREIINDKFNKAGFKFVKNGNDRDIDCIVYKDRKFFGYAEIKTTCSSSKTKRHPFFSELNESESGKNCFYKQYEECPNRIFYISIDFGDRKIFIAYKKQTLDKIIDMNNFENMTKRYKDGKPFFGRSRKFGGKIKYFADDKAFDKILYF